MATYKRAGFSIDSEEGLECLQMLKDMVADKNFNTDSTYSPNETLYPDNLIPFVDKHIAYLRTHSTVDPQQYLSNLRLITRIR